MRRFIAAAGGTMVGVMMLAGTVAAAGPNPAAGTPGPKAVGGTVAAVLNMTQAEVRALRQDGLSLAKIAEQQKVAVQNVIDALVARWTERIEARVVNGGLTAAQAADLKAQLETRARAMVESTTPGGMQGAAVGAGPRGGSGGGVRARDGSGAASGTRAGTPNGTCDGTGPHGPGRP